MSNKRKKKLKERRTKQKRANNLRFRRLQQALSAVGLIDSFDALPTRVQTILEKAVLPQPQLVLDPAVKELSEASEIKQWFTDRLEVKLERSREVPFAVSLREADTVLEGLKDLFANQETMGEFETFFGQWPDVLGRFLSFRRDWETFVSGSYPYVKSCLLFYMTEKALELSKPDDKSFWFGLSESSCSPSTPVEYVLQVLRPEQCRIRIGDETRRVFPCYSVRQFGPPSPIQWSREQIGLGECPAVMPVFFQSHAVEQWRERLPAPFTRCSWWSESLAEPTVECREGKKFFVAYGIGEYRFGYFVCEVVEQIIVIKTFLFLTMSGTPEAKKLYAKLKLKRKDIEYHKLDDLQTFYDSDLGSDPEIAAALTDCGCGHLLNKKPEERDLLFQKARAASLRKYLGWRDPEKLS
jgi:hypothetical protein